MRIGKNLKRRAGLGLTYIIMILVMIGVLVAYVAPTLGSAKLPAIESNLKEDVKTLRDASEQYYGITGTYANVSVTELVAKGVLKGAIVEKLKKADGTAIDTANPNITDYYQPSYTDNAIKISLAGAGNGINLFIDASAETDMKSDLETNMVNFFKKATADKYVDGEATAVSTTAITAGKAANTDGKFMVTYP